MNDTLLILLILKTSQCICMYARRSRGLCPAESPYAAVPILVVSIKNPSPPCPVTHPHIATPITPTL